VVLAATIMVEARRVLRRNKTAKTPNKAFVVFQVGEPGMLRSPLVFLRGYTLV
jgi:hypothetical protein